MSEKSKNLTEFTTDDELAALVKAATAAAATCDTPWRVMHADEPIQGYSAYVSATPEGWEPKPCTSYANLGVWTCHGVTSDDIATHIALANPAAILRLAGRIRQAEAERDNARLNPFIAVMASQLSYVGEPDTLKVCATHEEAENAIHDFFLGYEFEIREGNPFDANSEDGCGYGFDVFSNVKMKDGKVIKFMHCNGIGPVGWIVESM